MGIRTKKVGITGKYATRYGQKLRKQVKAIEILQRVKSICPFCGKKSIRREAAGIWKCRGCRRAIAGGAWEFVTTAATTAKTTINRLKKNLESRKKPEKEREEDEEEEQKQKKGQKDKGEKKEKKGKKENKDNKEKDKKEDKKDDKNIVLKSEKDYIEMAIKNAQKIKDAKPLPIYTLAYMQNIIELLGPSLEINQINEVLKISNNIYNKKLKEGEKKKVSKKVNIKVGKINDRNDKLGDYGDDEEDEEEEEEEEEHEGIDIDKYIQK